MILLFKGPSPTVQKSPKPTNRNRRKKTKSGPPFAHGVPPLPAITGDQPNDPSEKIDTHWLHNHFAANASNLEFPIVERVKISSASFRHRNWEESFVGTTNPSTSDTFDRLRTRTPPTRPNRNRKNQR
ncbi:hypothetical protein F2Q69_00048944 [Brassica cretica]|uniref:Uncharacterized protein n=1 Tax=Brassica cretica TaxID=69181 RepID=A0A8S9PDT3_BRACR|nr:hypothetical protein F2Q69_00048944 [Brassica cretica]